MPTNKLRLTWIFAMVPNQVTLGVNDMLKLVPMILSAFTAATIATANPAGAQTPAGCPAAGIVETVKASLGEYTLKQFGPDTSDGSICVADAEGPGALFPGQHRSIYIWYDLAHFPMSSSYVENARNLLGALLSGQKNDGSFDVITTWAGRALSWSSTEVWQRIGQDTINVGTQSIAATRLRYESKPGGGTNLHVVWDFWYDPARHLLLKGHATVLSGRLRTTDFVVTAISGP
jgi:hypothetical protein